MTDINELLGFLDSRAATGLDLSPGDEISRQAADRIRYLSSTLDSAICSVNRLQADKTILREALIRIVGMSSQSDLEIMKTHLQAVLTLSGPNKDVEAALAGVNALLDTV